MTHLESITKKLHALLPELLELSFGCEVSLYSGKHKLESVICEHNKGEWAKVGSKRDSFKILGHEITLEHVLKALSIIGHYYTLNPSDSKTCWIEVKSNADFWTIGLPLHKQSPELHEFLDSLLPEPNEE